MKSQSSTTFEGREFVKLLDGIAINSDAEGGDEWIESTDILETPERREE